MEIKMRKSQHLMLILCIFIVCEKATLAVENSNTSDLSVLRNIFKTKKDMNCIQDYGVNVSNYLNIAPQNATRLCFLIKGSLSEGPSLNQVHLSPLHHLPNLQQLWILPAVNDFEVIKDFITSIHFNEEILNGTSITYLKELHIKITLWRLPTVNELLLSSKKLEVLQLSRVRGFKTMDEIRDVLSGVKLTSLKALSLSGMIDTVISFTALNLSIVLEPLQAQDLEYVDLSRNFIHVIYGSITAMWPKLRIIDLSYNMLVRTNSDRSILLDIFLLHPQIKIVFIEGQNADMITEHNAKRNRKNYNANRQKRSIHKQMAILPTFCMKKSNTTINDLINGEKFKFCDIIYCVVKNVRYFSNVAYFPCKVFPTFQFVMSNLDNSGDCSFNYRFPVAPRLMEVYAGHFGGSGHGTFHNSFVNICFQNNKLKTVVLPSMHSSTDLLLIDSMYMKYFSVSNSEVENLDLSDNKLHTSLTNPLVASLKYLTTLNLANNFISFTGSDTLYKYFPFMKRLDISYNNISSEDIPVNYFTNAVDIHDLNLAGNKLKKVSLNLSENLANLNISGNDISIFQLQTINDLKNFRRVNVLHIDLRNNKLRCGCPQEEISTVDLIKNAEKYNIEFIDSNLYTCINKNTTRLLFDIDMSQYKLNCNYPHLTLILSITLSNVALLTATLSSMMCYKYRYRLMTKFLKFKWHFQHHKDQNENYVYDAFVSCSKEDGLWVKDRLIGKLEKKYGFKLYIDYRDCPPGSNIYDEIAEKMKCSKMIMVVLSSNSLKSGMCELELSMAQNHHSETRKKLIMIKLGKIDDKDEHLTPFIRSILQSNMYISWPEETKREESVKQQHVVEDKKKLFWVQMANSLYDRDVTCCLFCRKIGLQKLQSGAEHAEQDINATFASSSTDEASMIVMHAGNDVNDTETLDTALESGLFEQGYRDYNDEHDDVDDKCDSELLLP